MAKAYIKFFINHFLANASNELSQVVCNLFAFRNEIFIFGETLLASELDMHIDSRRYMVSDPDPRSPIRSRLTGWCVLH